MKLRNGDVTVVLKIGLSDFVRCHKSHRKWSDLEPSAPLQFRNCMTQTQVV